MTGKSGGRTGCGWRCWRSITRTCRAGACGDVDDLADLATDDGRLRPGRELRERFAREDIDEVTVVGTYCGSGITAAHTALALHEAGVDADVYVGSWSEWITDPSRPVATGA